MLVRWSAPKEPATLNTQVGMAATSQRVPKPTGSGVPTLRRVLEAR
jgi:hypothetical protein